MIVHSNIMTLNQSSEDHAIFARICELIANIMGISPEDISCDTSLRHGLGMSGSDAGEFMEVYAKEFSVDMRLFDDWYRHFEDEGYTIGDLIHNLILRRPPPKRVPITVADLVNCAKAKKWTPPEHDPE